MMIGGGAEMMAEVAPGKKEKALLVDRSTGSSDLREREMTVGDEEEQ